MSKTTGLLTAILVLILFSPMSAFAVDPLDQVVEISCTGAIPNVNPCDIQIGVGRAVIFKMNTVSCDTVFVNGASPIATFTLRDTSPQKVVTFSNSGTFSYNVTDSTVPGDTNSTKTWCKVNVVGTPIPTLSQWGIFILVLLIVGTGIWILIRKRLAPKSGVA